MKLGVVVDIFLKQILFIPRHSHSFIVLLPSNHNYRRGFHTFGTPGILQVNRIYKYIQREPYISFEIHIGYVFLLEVNFDSRLPLEMFIQRSGGAFQASEIGHCSKKYFKSTTSCFLLLFVEKLSNRFLSGAHL